ncbi:bifunctional coenzyme A synthase isoform X2 [Eurytemora carolleeae]|uniref:bifunctional coenzyme A synthase isoform X2 n=1 Tax=Eurytemora carolleeae TaxID=1294199 RepID=UPI000C76D894|nr:bifunctional coenzyme A synthase isoform X2 [Eurytemora carolleeae]|eukprot:XP_023337100.1 bifunctional coenzyme A synthase-like isoform X2 [Eurytemora affinis]
MSTTHLTILAKGGWSQVIRRIKPLCTHIRGSAPHGTKVYLTFNPSLHSQLNNKSVAGWGNVCSSIYSQLGTKQDIYIRFLDQDQGNAKAIDIETLTEDDIKTDKEPTSTDRLYTNVCLGGTFDRLHAGHKILLTTALLRCTGCLTVGVTSPSLLGRKTLCELIEPLEKRISVVKEFIQTVNRNISHNVVEITDPFGPAIVDPDIECIVGSTETEKGCLAINEKRKEKELKPLDIHIIDLVQDDNREEVHEEEKISSSSARTRVLGRRLRSSLQPWDRSKGPYIIGLTGGSASGKSSVGRRLKDMGAGLVDCDKLGHSAYLPGSTALKKIVEEFGDQVLAEDGTINRRVLGGIVFSDRSKLEVLNQIVWPEIARMALEQAKQDWEAGHEVVVLDAAVLLEAGWNSYCHEIWVCLIPRDEAVSRIVLRDGKTAEEAEKRVDSQWSNQERCKVAHTVFCTLWDQEVTQRQVELAWNRLREELELSS